MFKFFILGLVFSQVSLAVAQTNANESKAKNYNRKIISVGGSITELIYALNADKSIIAVDVSSMYPEQAINKLPKVGYYRQLSAEGILSLQPTTLVGAKGTGPKTVIKQLEETGVKVKLFKQNEYSLQAWQVLVSDIAKFFNKEAEAKQLIKSKLTSIKKSQENRQFKKNTLNAILLMSAGQRGLMVAGKETMPDLLLDLAGLKNVAKDIQGYKTITNEGIIESGLDLIVMPGHVVKAAGGKKSICNNQTIKLALKNDCNLLIMDPLLILGMGSRIDLAVKKLTDYANTINKSQ